MDIIVYSFFILKIYCVLINTMFIYLFIYFRQKSLSNIFFEFLNCKALNFRILKKIILDVLRHSLSNNLQKIKIKLEIFIAFIF